MGPCEEFTSRSKLTHRPNACVSSIQRSQHKQKGKQELQPSVVRYFSPNMHPTPNPSQTNAERRSTTPSTTIEKRFLPWSSEPPHVNEQNIHKNQNDHDRTTAIEPSPKMPTSRLRLNSRSANQLLHTRTNSNGSSCILWARSCSVFTHLYILCAGLRCASQQKKKKKVCLTAPTHFTLSNPPKHARMHRGHGHTQRTGA